MRVSFALGLLAGGLVAAQASAADLGSGFGGGEFVRFARRAEPIVIYDYEPGSSYRAYWLRPWAGRRYFPSTGVKPEVGRDEDLSALEPPNFAQSYYRQWSTSVFIARALRGERPIPQEDVPQK